MTAGPQGKNSPTTTTAHVEEAASEAASEETTATGEPQDDSRSRLGAMHLVLALGYLGAAAAACALVFAILPWLAGSKSPILWSEQPPKGETLEVAQLRLNMTATSLTGREDENLADEGGLYDDSGLDRFRDVNIARDAGGPKIIPRSQRWQVYFPQGLSDGPYARQLDALGVELGVILGDGNVEYVSGISKSKPARRNAKLADEKRLYLTWSRGDLLSADRTLLHNAGVLGALDRIVLHFCPPGTEQQMAELELKFKDREPKDIYLTRFALKQTFRGYRLYVMEQIPRE